MYVDDAIMHLMLFWLLILPVGQTLTVTEWWRTGRSCWTRWRRITVPGMSVYCFLGNICLIYLVAGLWKFESPLWRDGFAVYVTLNMPIAHTPEMWGTPSLPWLRAANYMVLFIEPLLPLLFMLRCGHPLKWLGLVCQLGFHIGILATLNIPFANLAMLATAVLFFRDEIMRGLCRRLELPPLLCRPQHHQWLSRLACGVLVLLMFSMTSRFSTSKVTYIPAAAALWMMGIAQEYQLFNWIDEKNYTNRYDVRITQADGQEWTAPSDALLPPSLRASVIQGYLYDVNWIKLDDAYRPALKRSILTRMAQRFCRHHPLPGRISVQADLQRVLPPHVVPQHAPPRFVMSFECAESKPVLCQTMVDPEMACPSMSDSLLHMATGH